MIKMLIIVMLLRIRANLKGRGKRREEKCMYGKLMVLLLLFSCLTYFYLEFSDYQTYFCFLN